MKITYKIYVVTDSHGYKQATVANESSQTVQISGMKGRSGEDEYFESEAYHLKNWCDEIGAHLNIINMDADV